MAKAPKTNFFLERAPYRNRRVADAARVLPVLGGVLIMMPLLWPKSPAIGEVTQTSGAGVYLFGIWALVILVAAILAPRLAQQDEE